VCGLEMADADSEYSVGQVEGCRKHEYKLDKGEFIMEVAGLFSKKKENISVAEVEDLSFRTSKGRRLGPEKEAGTKSGLIYRLPSQIFRLEEEAPSNFWWLQGFGLEKGNPEAKEKKPLFYPIWGFQSANKYYPEDYQGVEFIAGVKKQFQYSVDGIAECLTLNTCQDLNTLEKTPVYEVVDLEDSEEEEEEEAELEQAPPKQKNTSVTILDTSNSEDEMGEEEEEDDEESMEMSSSAMGQLMGHQQLGEENEPIEIESSDDEDQPQPGSGGKKRAALAEEEGGPPPKKS